MIENYLDGHKGTSLRKNGKDRLVIYINESFLNDVFLINGPSFITESLSIGDLSIAPFDYYMLLNNGKKKIKYAVNLDISKHKIIYNPYKYEHTQKVNIDPKPFIDKFNVPKGFVDVLSKWYSIKFTYRKYNLIYIKPEMGISIQIHKYRDEAWEVLAGKPIIINGNRVYYFIKNGSHFINLKDMFHSVINPNKDPEAFVILKESWSGKFDEQDIRRVYNPNNYY
ncbi:MAG: hypothetical protein ACFFFB_04175 [Candidatus Heimdallarchaeota archaeon]